MRLDCVYPIGADAGHWFAARRESEIGDGVFGFGFGFEGSAGRRRQGAILCGAGFGVGLEGRFVCLAYGSAAVRSVRDVGKGSCDGNEI
jgi:hypothetical protein